jgi:hypothetical protein
MWSDREQRELRFQVVSLARYWRATAGTIVFVHLRRDSIHRPNAVTTLRAIATFKYPILTARALSFEVWR